ncbi:hypothetical protein F2P56_008069, partial [Juglans regia]
MTRSRFRRKDIENGEYIKITTEIYKHISINSHLIQLRGRPCGYACREKSRKGVLCLNFACIIGILSESLISFWTCCLLNIDIPFVFLRSTKKIFGHINSRF